MKAAIAAALTIWLSGCSLVALQQEQSLEQRLTALESRVHALEVPKP